MTTIELLARLRGLNIKLWAEDGRLRFQAPKGALTDELRAALAEHKAEVLAMLQEALTVTQEGQSPIPLAPPSDMYPLSFAQQRLWFLDQLEPGSPLYNIPAAVRLTGDLDQTALRRSFAAIVARHAVLRTTFAIVDQQPVQVIAPPAPIALPTVDLRHLPADAREAAARRLAEQDALQPFDLQRGPLLRVTLLQLADTAYVVLVTMHHSISDGWSVGVVIRELALAYPAFARGVEPTLPALPIQYVDFAVWQRQWLSGAVLDGQLAYWQQQLRGAPTVLELPTDRPRPLVQSFRGATLPIRLAPALSQALHSLSQQEGATLFMLLLAGWYTLLFRYTGQQDILVGSPIANRTRTEVQDLIGFFVNTLVLRGDLAGNPSFRDLLSRVRQMALGAFAHQDLPFERLVEALQPERHLSRSALFQVMFVLQNAPVQALRLPGLTLEALDAHNGTAKFDLSLLMSETIDGLTGTLEYNTDLFDETTMARLLGHFQRVLAGMVADPTQAITTVPLLTPAEQQHLLVEWNATARPYPADQCFHTAFEAQVARTPEAVAVVADGQQLTYGALNQRANQLAQHLRTLGVGPDTLVGLWVERSLELLIGVLGILKAGGAYVPLDPTYPAERLAFMVADAQLSIIVTADSGSGAPVPPALAARCTVLDLVADQDRIARQSTDPPPVAVTPEHLAYVIYTSGSTGTPKGVMIAHRAVRHLASALQHAIYRHHAARPLRVTLNAPLSFDASVQQLVTLLYGATLYVLPDAIRRDGHALVAYLREHRLDGLDCVPAQLPLLLAAGLLDAGVWVPALALVGGDALDEATWRVLADAPATAFYNVYGPTECTVDSTTIAAHQAPARPTIGRPLSNVQVYVLDAQTQPVPVGVPGELYIGGAGVARGYLHRPALTAEKFIADPFSHHGGARLYRTGDLVRWLPDGTLEFLGRLDTQVKVRGFRIELGEIEAVLRQQAGVRDTVVIVREDRPGDQRIVGYVVVTDEQPATSEVLRTLVAQHLPTYMVPSAILILDTLPLTPNGKIDRKALPAPDGTRPELEHAFVAPRTATEALLVELWSDVLGTTQLGVHDNFFTLGGHSLLATQLVSRVWSTFAVDLPLREVFAAPTVAELATRIDALRAADQPQDHAPPLEPTDHTMPQPLSFAQQRLWFLDQLEPGSPLYNIPAAVRLTGDLDQTALRRSFATIVARHAVLRTTFAIVDQQPVQVIAPPAPIALPTVDLRHLPADAREAAARRLAEQDALQPFDLQRGPLLRVTLLQLADTAYVVLVTMHHSISDGWSVGVVIRELALAYSAFARGVEPTLPALPIQYVDFAVWQRQWLSGAVLDGQLAYWQQQLRGAPTVLELPTDRPRPPVQSFHGATLPLRLAPALSQALHSLSQQEGATLFMTLLASWYTLLFRYTGQQDILVGTPIANRNRREIEPLIGFFVNTLVLRGNLAGNPSFRELLGRVRQMALGAFAHQDLPFEMLVEAVQSERHLSRNPLFQVMFVLQNAPAQPLELPGLTLEALTLDNGTAKFDLTLGIIEQADGLTGELEYNTDLFDETTMARLLGHFQRVLAGMVADPDQPIARLPLLTPAEQQHLLVEWNATAAPFPRDLCLPQLVEAQANHRPDALAVTCAAGTREQVSLTYRQLDRQANQLAHYLQALGVGPDVCVGLHLTRSLDFVIGALAVLKAGGAYLPLDPAYPPERVAFMLEDAQAPLLLTQHHLPEVVPSHKLHQIYLDSDWMTIAEQPETLPCSLATADHLAYVIYTSGSTGVPKGVGVPHRGALNLVTWHQRAYNLTHEDRASLLAGLAFDASVWEIWPYLASGASLHLPAEEIRSAPGSLVEWLIAQDITLCFMPTPLAEAVIAEPQAEHLRLRALLTGGDVLHNQEWSRLAFPVINHYGPTENTVVTTCGVVGDSSTPLPTIGRPIANTQVYLLDRYGQPVPVNVPGELYISGESLARGYLNRTALTAEKFVPHSFAGQAGIPPGARLYRSGDLARYLPDGTIEFIGRIDQQVKIRGFRIEIGEIEAALLRHPDVRDVVVLVHENSPLISEHVGKRLVAYLITDTTPAPALSELRSFLQKSLPDYMVPSAFVLLDALPLTPNGKVDRKALPAPEANRAELEHAFVAPRTATEALLVELWSDVLGMAQIGVHDNFFAMGGHSLLATQLVSRVRSALAVDLPLREVFAAPTVAALATRIEALRGDNQAQDHAPPLQPTDRSGPQPLSFSQERLWFLDQLEPNSLLYTIPSVLRVAGYLDASAFEWSLNAIISRHEILRTTFTLVAGKPVQVIAPPTPINISSVDLRSLPPDEREAAARELVSTEAQKPFNLQRGPLLRVTLLQLADTEHIVVFTQHHIISDGWSVGVIVGELGQLYSAFTRGEEPALPALPIQYADFAVWQRNWLQGAALERQLRYWQHQLGSENSRGPVPLLDLPTDRPRPAVQSYGGNAITWTLPQSLTDGLYDLSQREQVTPFMTLLAAFQVLLFRYSGQDDIAVGTPIANRNRREIEGLIGCFINTLVLRTDLSGAPSFQKLLGRVRQSTLGAYDHQDVPFEVLVDTLQPTRQLSYNPLFQVMFVMQNTPAQALDLPDIRLSMVEIETSTAKTDLSLEIVPIGDTLISSFVYNTDLFDQATIERMIGHFQTVLAGIVADPAQTITAVPLLTADEQQELLVDWNATADFYPDHLCIHQLFEAQVARTPDSTALVADAERLSYAELNRRANQVAHSLRKIGVRPGVRVGLCFQPSIGFIVGLLGVLKAGAAYVPLDPSYPTERLGFMLDDAHLLVLLTQSGLAPELPEDRTRVIYLDRDWATIAQEPSDNLINLVTPDHLAYTIYTSGSTGQPKGASVYQRGVINLLHWFTGEFGISAEDRALVITSLSFDLTQKNLFAPLIMGGQLHLFAAKHYDVELITQQIAEHHITLLNCTPSAFYPLADHDGTPARNRLASLRYVFLGGEPIAVARLEAWAARAGSNTQLVNTYGPTECTDIASFYRVDHLERFRDAPIPIGYPITNFSLFVLDRQMEPVPVGVAGELYIGGIGLGQGYLNRPELTAEKFVPHPFSSGETGRVPSGRLYRTGDLVRYQPDGAIVFLGRIDHQVKVRGFRIELGEIEVALLEHSALRDAVVVAREDTSPTGGYADKRLVAYLVADTTPPPSVSELRSFLKDLLPEYMVPAAFVYLDALPLTPNGKVDRKALPAPEANRAELERSYVAPRTELERVLAQMWSEHFRVERVGIDDSFFELGGNSIQGAVFINRLQELLGEYVSVVALFEAPNIADLASYLVSQHSTALARSGLTGEAGEDRGEQLETAEHGQLGQILPVPRGEGVLLPLSFAQQRLWFLDQLEPGSPLYNIPSAVRLTGHLDLHALQRTIDIIAERHESLRTTFAVVDGQPIQIIAPVASIALPTVDLRTLPPDERDAAVQELALQEAQQPFDLERGPLMRVTLVLLDTGEHVLLFTLHHIISDGWSMGVLIREIATIYMAVADQRPVMLPELRVQYADFAVWQRDWFQGPLLEQQLAYWQQQLRGAPAMLELPTDRPRPSVQSFRGATLPFRLAPALSQALQALSQQEGATLFMTLLAAWYTLLFRYTGQDDILIGSPIANRTRREIEGLIGFFVNTLVLRGDLAGNPTFRDLLGRVRQMALGAFAHQDLPFEYLVEVLQPERDLSRSPLFQVMFMLQNTPAQALQLPDLTLQPLDAHNGMAKFDLLLSVVEQPGGLVGDLEYNTDLFDQTTMARLLEHFETLLTGIVADAAQPIGSLLLLTDAEQQQLVEWNATAMFYPALAAHQLVEQQALRTPDSVAVIFGADTHERVQLTYHDLDARANQLAHHLHDLGVGTDVPVGLCMERSLELVVGILGILKAGGAYVPLDPHYPAERLALMLSNAQAPVVLTAPSQVADQRTMLEARFAGTTVDLVSHWPEISQHPTHAPEIAVDLDQLAYVIYTSGSTGVPKGVAMPHRPLVNMIAWQQTVISGAARTLQFASPSFDVSFQEIFTTWASGGTLVLPPEALRRDPEALAAFLDQQRIERLFMPFVALQQLAEALSAQGHVPADLRDVITAGEQLQITPAIAEWFRASPHCRLHNHYGPSETHVVTAHTLAGDLAHWPALPPIGKPIANTQAYLLDRGTQPLPIGAIGELYFAGDSLARGYLHRPELTAERFITLELEGIGSARTTRLYKTGDLARYRPDGVLEFLGRADSQVKIRGYRIEPGEIENVLAQHAAVREAVVVVRPNADGMAQLVAYVVPSDSEQPASGEDRQNGHGAAPSDQQPLRADLRAYLKERLPDYMVPTALVVLERWPLTPSGKIDRRALPAPGDMASATPDTFVAPRDTLELRLARIWEVLLGVRTVGIRDNFFELGGHSLLVVRLMAQIQAQIGQKIPLATLFQEPTIEHLAQALRQLTTKPLNTPLIAIQPGGDKLPFFCVHPAAGSVLSYLELARLLGPDQPFYGLQAAGLEGEQTPHTQVEAMATEYLAALRAVQPQGPYLLGGWSFGGLVAFEMARQLTAQGDEVALLALFDSRAPTAEPAPLIDQATLLAWFANDLGRTFSADLNLSPDTLAAIAPEHGLQYVLDQARSSGILPPDIGEREITAYFDVFTSSLRAMQDYQPRPYPGRVTLFRAGDRPLDEAGETLGWEALAADGVSVQAIPGDHYTIIRQPQVTMLANELHARLDEVQTLRTAQATDE